MKSLVASSLSSYLNYLCENAYGAQYCLVDLYTITLQNGLILRWAAWPISITFPTTGIYASGSSVGGNTRVSGQTFSGTAPYVSRSKLIQGVKLEVSQVKMTVLANPTMTVGSTPILQAISQGMFAGASVYVDRLWAQNVNPGAWHDYLGNAQTGFDYSLGTMNWFAGQVAELESVTRAKAVLSVKDPTALLGADWPRNLYMTGCQHSFGDAGCTFNRATVTTSGTVTSTTTPTTTTFTTSLTTGAPIAAPSAPSLTTTGHLKGVNVAAATYFVMITYTGPNGESAASPESYISITGSNQSGANGTTDQMLVVNSPSSISGATGWNVYVGMTYGGSEQLQASITGFGTSWQAGDTLAQGGPAPAIGQLGYYNNGFIVFTSGANQGLTQAVQNYSLVGGHGVVVTSPPLPTAPAIGDAFSICPDCDKTMATCNGRYSNLINFKGYPFLPLPEVSA